MIYLHTSIVPNNYSIPTPSHWSPKDYGMSYDMPGMPHTPSTGYPTTVFNITSPMYAWTIDMQSSYNFTSISHLNLKQAQCLLCSG